MHVEHLGAEGLMHISKARWRGLSALLCGVLGLLTILTGLYFALLRPAMLPEDQRLTGVVLTSLPKAFTGWLSIVFRTWAGFTVGFGVLLAGCAGYLRTENAKWIRGGVALSVIVAFGSFLASNVQIGSDFLWYIATLFVLAALTAFAILWRGA